MKKNFKKNNAITLISLVVTIIILIILAGVSINLVLGKNGIIEKARVTSERTKKENIIEQIRLDLLEQQVEGEFTNNKSNLISALLKYGEVKEENGDFILTLEDGTKIKLTEVYTDNVIEDNAIYIYTKAELEVFRDNVNSGNTYSGKTIMLMNDIDLGGKENDENSWWEPIGLRSLGREFQGVFNGNNYTIRNMHIYNTNSEMNEYAFFGSIKNAIIKNINVTGIVSVGNTNSDCKSQAAGIIGRCQGENKIENCINKVDVTNLSSSRSTAGIIGGTGEEAMSLTIKNCINYGTIEGNECASGIISNNGRIKFNNRKLPK